MADILNFVGINAPAAKVYAALTEQRGLSGWWTESVSAEPKTGCIAQFRFDGHGPDMKVVELIPNKCVRWQCVDGPAEWIGTEISFDLNEKDGATKLLFAQRGWREPVEFMHFCSTKWATFLLSLKALCETGSGSPYPRDVQIS